MKNFFKGVFAWGGVISLLFVLLLLSGCNQGGATNPSGGQPPSGESHTCKGIEWRIDVDPTCKEAGVKNLVCSCGKTIQTEELPVVDHKAVIVPAKASTCTETGLTEGKKCEYCDLTIVAQQEIPLSEHTERILPAKSATCIEKGLTEGKDCSVCGEVFVAQEELPLSDHKEWIIFESASTCIKHGWTRGKKCLICGEVLVAQTELPLADHKEKIIPAEASTCTKNGCTEGVECAVCGEILDAGEELPLADHTVEIIPAKAATCVETGLTEGEKCAVCGEILAEQQILPALLHDEIHHDAKEASCTEDGWDAYVTCTRCDYTTYARRSMHEMVDDECEKCGCVGIRTAEGLQSISSNLSGNYMLLSDIDLSGIIWTPLGTFTGTLNGDGHVISNLTIYDQLRYAGMFEKNEGTIQNLGMKNVFIDTFSRDSNNGDAYVGGLVAYNKGTIKNCYVEGRLDHLWQNTYTSVFGKLQFVGGLVGYNVGTVANSAAEIDVICNLEFPKASGLVYYVGGLVGVNDASISSCYATGSVSVTVTQSEKGTAKNNAIFAGGLVGVLGKYHSKSTIENCYATGAVNSRNYNSDNYTGGLIGAMLRDGCSAKNCYATGNVTNRIDKYLEYPYTGYCYAGAFIGLDKVGVSYSYAAGNLTIDGETSDWMSGFNYNEYYDVKFEKCYCALGMLINGVERGYGKELSVLQSESFLTSTLGWSSDVWNFAEGAHPTLKNAGLLK